MADDNRNSNDEERNSRKTEFRVPPRTWIIWIAIFGGIILLMLLRERMDSQAETLTQYQFQQLVDSNLIVQATINYNPQNPLLTEIIGKYRKGEGDAAKPVTFRAKARLTEKMEEKLFAKP